MEGCHLCQHAGPTRVLACVSTCVLIHVPTSVPTWALVRSVPEQVTAMRLAHGSAPSAIAIFDIKKKRVRENAQRYGATYVQHTGSVRARSVQRPCGSGNMRTRVLPSTQLWPI